MDGGRGRPLRRAARPVRSRTKSFKSQARHRRRVPKGVAKEFLSLLEGHQRLAVRQVAVLGAVAVLLLGPAYYMAPPWGLATSAAAVLVGAAAGLLWAQRRTRRYEDSLRGSWTAWMRNAVASDTVPELHRRVRGRRGAVLPYLWAAALTALWAVEVLLLVLALNDETAVAWAHAAAGANGLVVGLLLGNALRTWRWTRAFRDSLGDMLAAGEVGLWGVV